MFDFTSTLLDHLANAISGSQTFLKHISIAIGAGGARYLHGYLSGNDFAFRKFIAHAFVSGFSGWFLASTVFQYSEQWSYFFAGIGGYMGTQAFDVAVHLTYKYLNRFSITYKGPTAGNGSVELSILPPKEEPKNKEQENE